MGALSVLWILTLASTSPARAALVGWWTFDETSGTTAADSSGSGNHGTLMNGPTWATGKMDGAVSLDGTDDYVELPIGSLVSSLGNATLAVWANWSGQGGAWQRIFDFGTGTANYIYLCPEDGDGLMHAAITADTGTWTDVTVSSGTLPTGWHHVAVVIDETAMNLKILLDGRIVADAATLYVLRDLRTTTLNWLGRSQYADPYFNGMLDDFRIYDEVLSEAQIRRIMVGDITVSRDPHPPDKATDVPRDTALSWTSGEFADTHDVYLGTRIEDVSAASTADPAGVLVSQSQEASSFDPGRLELGQTYYWRVDEVNSAPDFTVFKGAVWSFTVEPFSYPIPGVVATASGSSKANMGPEKTVDGSGLNELDQHDTDSTHSWLSSKGDSAWIQFDFDGVYKLDKALVWNCNQALESILGVSAKDVTVEYSADGETWTALGDFEFPQAPGTEDYVADTVLEFAGAPAQAVKFTITSNWGDVLPQYGLSEVRFYFVPVTAREPSPAADANDVDPQVVLSWRAGREADSHQVYLGEDEQAVAEGTAPVVTVPAPEYETALMLDSTYYWKVTEVNDAEAIPAWDGKVWTFDTAHFVAVDDFESYTDDLGNRIYEYWIDGYDITTNGSLVGYGEAPFAEQTILYSGKQSMPFAYDNSGGVTISEATLSFDPAQDWTKHGITTLVLYFRGQVGNGAAPLYLKINDQKVSFNNGAAATAMPVWKQWTVPLASTGANLKSVKSLTIGVEGSGAGMLFFDDLRLYAVAPEAVVPVDPQTTGLAALYTMDGNVQDTAGKKYDGTLNGDASYEPGYAGQALIFNGVNAYVDLPIGALLSSLSDITITMWVNSSGTGGDWQRIFDFGTGTTNYMFLSSHQTSTGPMTFGIRTTTVAEVRVTAPARLPTGWHHVAVAISSATMTAELYLDGTVVGSNTMTVLPKDLGNTTQNYLGDSQWEGDAFFTGSLDEFRIYNRALSEGEVRYLAGDR